MTLEQQIVAEFFKHLNGGSILSAILMGVIWLHVNRGSQAGIEQWGKMLDAMEAHHKAHTKIANRTLTFVEFVLTSKLDAALAALKRIEHRVK